MRFIISLALKNLSRYKRRTIITAVAIAVGLMMYIVVDSILLGAEFESMRNLRWYETASARIMHPDYWEDRLMRPLDISIEDPYTIVDSLRKEGIAAAPRTMFSADLILYSEDFGEDGHMPVQVTAVDPELDNSVFRFEDTLIEGRFVESGTNELVIGSWFAEDIGAKVGYWVTLVTRGNGGFYEAMDMQIVGIVNCPNPNVNRTLLMVPIDTIGDYLAMEGAATEINITLPESAKIAEEVARIQQLLDPNGNNLLVVSWDDLARDYVALAEAKRGGTGMILFLVFIIAAVGISNTMLMAIYERIRELGMMRALGMNDRSIQLAFMVEAGGIGLIGSTIGVLLGIAINFYMVNVGIDFGLLMRDMDMGYRIQSSFRGTWNPSTIITAFFFGSILSMLVAWIPTRRALKMDIPSCLRHQ
ncbi:MAG: ABC transporter permease [Spirochaetae bacterium HGW-Spirochaetae-2]|nr:MAG: ABC transporter permease [Spirochaetae bacterium HGW-Spirochaetae-2]